MTWVIGHSMVPKCKEIAGGGPAEKWKNNAIHLFMVLLCCISVFHPLLATEWQIANVTRASGVFYSIPGVALIRLLRRMTPGCEHNARSVAAGHAETAQRCCPSCPISAEECATRADAHAAPHRQTARRTSIPKSKHFSPLRQSNRTRMLCPVRPSAVSALGGGAPAIVWHQLRGFRANGGACRIALNNSARPALRRSSQIWSHAGLNRGPYGYWPYALTN